MTQEVATIPLLGGLDSVTPHFAKAPGALIGGFNYEPDAQGYRRYIGHEAYDGHPRPSDATYYVVNFDAGGAAISADDLVTGGTSGATAYAVVDAVLETGSYGGADAAGYLVLRDVTGTFVDDEVVTVGGSNMVTLDGTLVERDAETDANDRTWQIAAEDARRTPIAAPAGSGAVRGLFHLDGTLWCVRDNAGATAGVLFKATSSGWSAQDLGYVVRFTAGTSAFVTGETLTGGTSSATGTIERIVLQSGAYSTNDAAGFMVVSGISGTYQAETGTSSSGSATLSGAQEANALPAGGRFQFIVNNFYGAAQNERAYGVSGQGRAFEWDGSVFCPIETGLSAGNDKPVHVAELSNHLFLGYAAGAVNFSGVGEPLDFRTTAGAGSFATGAAVTGMLRATSALVVLGADRIDYVSGNDSSDFQLTAITETAGAQRWTGAVMDRPLYVGDKAVRGLDAAESLGGWRMGGLSARIDPVFDAIEARGATPLAVQVVRARDLIRWFYDDGTAIVGYFGRGNPEFSILDLPITVNVAWTTEGDRLYVGATDGKVYQMDVGRTYDGSNVEAMARLASLHFKAPRVNKRFHGASLELDLVDRADLQFTADFNYGDPEQPPASMTTFDVRGGGEYWDTARWNNFNWSSPVVGSAEADISGLGFNMSMAIRTESEDEFSHVLAALHVYWTPRGVTRRRVVA